jgi:hypothetical protein
MPYGLSNIIHNRPSAPGCPYAIAFSGNPDDRIWKDPTTPFWEDRRRGIHATAQIIYIQPDEHGVMRVGSSRVMLDSVVAASMNGVEHDQQTPL